MIADLSTGASHPPIASCATAFACLLRLSRQACSNGQGGAVCRGVVDGDSLPLSRLVEFADELGLEAEHARSDWQGLQTIGFKHSILSLQAAARVGTALAINGVLEARLHRFLRRPQLEHYRKLRYLLRHYRTVREYHPGEGCASYILFCCPPERTSL
jgi:hypothetical protein